MSDKPEQRKSLVTTMPAILTGAAALIAAITRPASLLLPSRRK